MPVPTQPSNPPPQPRSPAGPANPKPPPGPRVGEPLWDMHALAAYFDVHVQTIKALVAAREVPFTRLPGGRLVRFTPDDVAEILAAGKVPVQQAPRRDEVVARRRTGPAAA